MFLYLLFSLSAEFEQKQEDGICLLIFTASQGIQTEYAGEYACEAVNSIGRTQCKCQVGVNDPSKKGIHLIFDNKNKELKIIIIKKIEIEKSIL